MANPYVADTAASAAQFFSTLQQQQQQAFSGNQTALDAVSKAWAPVLSSGAVPYGYSAGLDSLLKANVIDTGSQGIANATNESELRQKQLAGGADNMPTGAQAQINADINATGQQKIAEGLQKEKIAGFQQGETNLKDATSAELGIAGAEDAPQLASASTGAGNLALDAGKEQWKENQATGPMSIFNNIMGGIKSVAGAVSGIGDIGALFHNPGSGGGDSYGGAPGASWDDGGGQADDF